MKSKGPKTDTCGTPERISKGNEKCLESAQKTTDSYRNHESSYRNRQKAHTHNVCDVKYDARCGHMQSFGQNRYNQLDV